MSSNFASSFPLSDDPTTKRDASAIGGVSPSANVGEAARSGQDLLGRVVQGAHDTVDRLAETAAPHVQRLQEGVSSATDAVQSGAGKLRETGDEWAESLRTTVRENPLAALATALAVGMLVSRLTRR